MRRVATRRFGVGFAVAFSLLCLGRVVWSCTSQCIYSTSVSASCSGSTCSGTTYVEGTVTITVSATDQDGLTGMELYVDGSNVATWSVSGTSATKTWPWTTASYSEAQHSIYATATDRCDNTASSPTIYRTVDRTAPSSCTITAPGDGAVVTGAISVSASASDNFVVKQVSFYRDGGTLIGTDTDSPFSVSWNTTTVADGSHPLYAVAYDCLHHSRTSPTITVTVDNSGPSVEITEPGSGSAFCQGDQVLVKASASDPTGVDRVEFRYSGTASGTIGTDSAPPDCSPDYCVTWDTTGLSAGSYTITATAYDTLGHQSTASILVSIGGSPAISIAKPAEDYEYVGGTTFVKAYIIAPLGVSEAKVYVDQKDAEHFKGNMTSEADYWKYMWDTSGTATGNHKIIIQAVANGSGCTSTGERWVYAHPTVQLYKISFQDDHTLWDRAVDEEIVEPQWGYNEVGELFTKPFAYTIGSQMTVDAGMTSPDVRGNVEVRYVVSGTWSDGTDYATAEKTGAGTFVDEVTPVWLAHYPTAPSRAKQYWLNETYTFYVRRSASSDWAPAGASDATQPSVLMIFGEPVGPWGPADNARACWSVLARDACQAMPSVGYTASEAIVARSRLAQMLYWWVDKTYNGQQTHYVPYSPGPTRRFELWEFIGDVEADCRDMSLAWEMLCGSVGLDVNARRVQGPFDYRPLSPVHPIGEPEVWAAGRWSFHHIGKYGNQKVFDPCVRLDSNPENPSPGVRVPMEEGLVIPYARGLWAAGYWMPLSSFHLGEVDPFYGVLSEVN